MGVVSGGCRDCPSLSLCSWSSHSGTRGVGLIRRELALESGKASGARPSQFEGDGMPGSAPMGTYLDREDLDRLLGALPRVLGRTQLANRFPGLNTPSGSKRALSSRI